MKYKRALTGIAALACVTAAHAQSAGTFYVTSGWLHFAPQSSSDPLKETNVGGSPVDVTLPNTGANLDNGDTIGFTGGYFVTDHIATEFVIGVPPKFNLDGSGAFSSYGKLGDAKQWSPTLLFKYYFRDAQARFRPYLAVGVTHVSFTDEAITNSVFEEQVLHGPTSVSTDSSWEPVFNGGFTFAFDKHWFAGWSLSYIPLSVNAKLNTAAQTPVGVLNVQSQTKIKLNPIVSYINIGYNF
jgi:outer membrane protein